LVLEYYLLLRSVLHAKPHWRTCLSRCRQCRIFFLTHPRNAGRRDLRCPFGCRETHRKQQSTQRSVAYYRDPRGKRKKSDLNQKRRGLGVPTAGTPTVPTQVAVPTPSSPPWNPPLLVYVRMVVSLIEGRPVSGQEVRAMLEKVLRQHTMPNRRKIDQTVAWLNENPP
jgi:hypothetical protein